MNYPEEICAPMRAELTSVGFVELKTPEGDLRILLEKREGTSLLMVNSVCGCAAGNARPAVKMAIEFDKKPDVFATVFAGQDIGATAKTRNICCPTHFFAFNCCFGWKVSSFLLEASPRKGVLLR